MDAEMEAFETHLDRMEREKQAQDSQLALEKERTKRAKVDARADTKEMLTWILGTFLAVVMVLGLSYIIWQGNKGPSASEQLQDKWRTECIDHNGTWIPDTDSHGNITGTCYLINGKQPIILGKQ